MLLVLLPLLVSGASDNVQTTRTSIKVARNLDPDAMETLEVKTRTGDVATIVVKKRDGRQQLEANPSWRPVASSRASPSSTSRAASVPEPVVVRSDSVYVKNEKDVDADKRSRSLFTVDSDGIPVITGVREPDDENDTQVWRNARVINGILVPNGGDKNAQQPPHKEEYDKPSASPVFNGVWQVYRKKPEQRPAILTAEQRPVFLTAEQRPVFSTVERQPANAALPDEKYMTDKILGYIKNINGNILDGEDRAARAMFAPEPKMEARVMHAPSVSVFPNSAAYSPPKTVSRLAFEESARAPVLQYAHPELGVQAAKYEPPQPVQPTQPTQPLLPEDSAGQRDGRRQQALSYFGHDIHADRSPFAFEPGLEKESRVKVPKKYSAAHYSFPDKHGKYSNPAGHYGNNDDASFWTMMKNKMRTSLDTVSDYTRPVVDPLVEATHKITGNLGFGHGNRELTNVVKEKLGMVATPSVLLPALGLVAGGAALGLGAVAVGRSVEHFFV